MHTLTPAVDWFADWFDTPYYHQLYWRRDDAEARRFLDNLLKFIHIPRGSRILDLACGAGRHSVYLHEKGYEVVGVDLSAKSIETARKRASNGLQFETADMRRLQYNRRFDLVVNLFTSFGYFDEPDDHKAVLSGIALSLKPNGYFALDYFNSVRVANTLAPEETQNANGIDFHLRRRIENGCVVKTIEFTADGRDWHFEEKVRLFTPEQLQNMCAAAGLQPVALWGDYDGSPYEAETSTRAVVFAQKEG